MKVLLKISGIILILLSFFNVKAQKSSELGILIGAANYYGDINTNFSFDYVRPSATLMYRRNFNYYFSGKTLLTYAQVGGSDLLVNNAFQQTRKLSFKSDIWEASAQLELNFMKYALKDMNRYFTPYLNIGFSIFRFNPKREVDGEVYTLQDFGTEGQENPDISGKTFYDLFGFAFPIGIGFKYWVKGQWTFGFDVTYRMSSTDFIDDINDVYVDDFILSETGDMLADNSTELGNDLGSGNKQRGNPLNNDDFVTAGFYFTYTFKKLSCPYAREKRSAKLRAK